MLLKSLLILIISFALTERKFFSSKSELNLKLCFFSILPSLFYNQNIKIMFQYLKGLHFL